MLPGFLLITFHLNLNLIYTTSTLKANNFEDLQVTLLFCLLYLFTKKTSLIHYKGTVSQKTNSHLTPPTSLIIRRCLKS